MQIARKEKKYLPRGPCAKACTELTSPVRVSEVPKIHRRKVVEISTMFQTFIMPFFSCIMTEWRKAVPLSQGSREAFSTESQPQYTSAQCPHTDGVDRSNASSEHVSRAGPTSQLVVGCAVHRGADRGGGN